MRLAKDDKPEPSAEWYAMRELQRKLEDLRYRNGRDDDIDSAYWTLDLAINNKQSVRMAMNYASEVIARYEAAARKPVELKTRMLTKAEHDALLDGPAPNSVSKEDYERMMREAQE